MRLENAPGEDDFEILLILAEIGMALGQGSTSVSNSYLYASKLPEAAGTSQITLELLKYVCAFSLGLGVYLSGDNIIKKVGTKFVSYATSAAFCAQFTAMALTLVSSTWGYPTSTTQLYIFALVGIRLVETHPPFVHMERRFFRQIIIWWLLLMPICVLLPFLLSYILSVLTHRNGL